MSTALSPIRSRQREIRIARSPTSWEGAAADGSGRLPRQQRLDRRLDPEVDAVDLVVAGDHLVGAGVVGGLEDLQHDLERAAAQPSGVLQQGLDLVQLVLELLAWHGA